MATNVVSVNRAIWLWVGTAFVLDVAGAQHVYARPSVAAAGLLAVAIAWLVPSSSWPALARTRSLPRRLLALLPIAALVAAMIDVAAFVPKDSGWTPLRLLLLIGGALGFLALNRTRTISIALLAFALGTAIRIIHMRHVEIVPANGDMLPLVQGAIDNLLAGRSPYRMYHMPWDVPLTYLPVTWLSYLPPYLLGLDMRWTNIVAEVVILGVLLWLSKQSRPADWSDDPALALWGWLYLQPSVIHWDMGNTAPITWALIAVTFALVLAGRERVAAIALGLSAAGTPIVAVFGPLIGLHWLRKVGLPQTVRLLIISGLIAGAIILPFLMWSPQDFVTGTYRWFNDINRFPREKWNETDPHVWSIITGFSGEFWARGAEQWLKPIQALIVAGIAGLYWLRGARASRLSAHAIAAYLGFMLFNPVLWPYLYNPALIVGLVGIAALTLRETAEEIAPMPVIESRRRKQPLPRTEGL